MTSDAETPLSAHTRLKRTFSSNLTHDLSFRRTQLKALRQHLHTHESAHMSALYGDLRKPKQEALAYDILPLFADLAYLLRNLDRLARPKLVSRDLGAPVYTRKSPKGVVLVIGAFNFPVQLVVRPLIAAIAAGNCVVIKPSELATESEKFLSGLTKSLDSRIFACVTGGIEVSKQLLDLKWDHIVFTGSGRVGRIIMSAAAKHLTPVTLELGGKSPALVTEHAHLPTAVANLVRARFTNCGQFCLAVDYCLVHDAVYEQFRDMVVEKVRLFYGDDPKSCPVYGRLISSAHLENVSRMLERSNGTVLIGGQVDDSDAHYIAPTVVEVKEGDALLQDEIFGPVLPLLRVKTTNDAINYINARDSPLALYLFSMERDQINSMVMKTRSGSVGVNDAVFQVSGKGTFIGGFGESGMGAYGMGKGFDNFSHERPVMYSSPFWSRFTGFMLPHRMRENNPGFDKLIRVLGKMPFKGSDGVPVHEKCLGGFRRVGAAIVAVFMLLFQRKKSKKD